MATGKRHELLSDWSERESWWVIHSHFVVWMDLKKLDKHKLM